MSLFCRPFLCTNFAMLCPLIPLGIMKYLIFFHKHIILLSELFGFPKHSLKKYQEELNSGQYEDVSSGESTSRKGVAPQSTTNDQNTSIAAAKTGKSATVLLPSGIKRSANSTTEHASKKTKFCGRSSQNITQHVSKYTHLSQHADNESVLQIQKTATSNVGAEAKTQVKVPITPSGNFQHSGKSDPQTVSAKGPMQISLTSPAFACSEVRNPAPSACTTDSGRVSSVKHGMLTEPSTNKKKCEDVRHIQGSPAKVVNIHSTKRKSGQHVQGRYHHHPKTSPSPSTNVRPTLPFQQLNVAQHNYSTSVQSTCTSGNSINSLQHVNEEDCSHPKSAMSSCRTLTCTNVSQGLHGGHTSEANQAKTTSTCSTQHCAEVHSTVARHTQSSGTSIKSTRPERYLRDKDTSVPRTETSQCTSASSRICHAPGKYTSFPTVTPSPGTSESTKAKSDQHVLGGTNMSDCNFGAKNPRAPTESPSPSSSVRCTKSHHKFHVGHRSGVREASLPCTSVKSMVTTTNLHGNHSSIAKTAPALSRSVKSTRCHQQRTAEHICNTRQPSTQCAPDNCSVDNTNLNAQHPSVARPAPSPSRSVPSTKCDNFLSGRHTTIAIEAATPSRTLKSRMCNQNCHGCESNLARPAVRTSTIVKCSSGNQPNPERNASLTTSSLVQPNTSTIISSHNGTRKSQGKGTSSAICATELSETVGVDVQLQNRQSEKNMTCQSNINAQLSTSAHFDVEQTRCYQTPGSLHGSQGTDRFTKMSSATAKTNNSHVIAQSPKTEDMKHRTRLPPDVSERTARWVRSQNALSKRINAHFKKQDKNTCDMYQQCPVGTGQPGSSALISNDGDIKSVAQLVPSTASAMGKGHDGNFKNVTICGTHASDADKQNVILPVSCTKVIHHNGRKYSFQPLSPESSSSLHEQHGSTTVVESASPANIRNEINLQEHVPIGAPPDQMTANSEQMEELRKRLLQRTYIPKDKLDRFILHLRDIMFDLRNDTLIDLAIGNILDGMAKLYKYKFALATGQTAPNFNIPFKESDDVYGRK